MDENTVSFDYRNLLVETLRNKLDNFLIGIAVSVICVVGAVAAANNVEYLSFNFRPKAITQNQPKNTKVVAAKPATYQIQEGDWIWKVAEDKYGDGNKAEDILKANNISDPNELKVGQILILPSNIPTVTPSMAPSATPTITLTPTPTLTKYKEQGDVTDTAAQTKQVTFKGKKYTIQKGDGIWQIAEKAYGDGMMWSKIAEANKLQSPYNLEEGKTITIPR